MISITKDKAKTMENGLLEVTEATRAKRHHEKSPTWDDAAPFDFETRYDTLRHPKPR